MRGKGGSGGYKWRKPVARGGCTKMLGINQSRTPYAGVNWAAAIEYAMLLYLSSKLFFKIIYYQQQF